MGCRLVWDMGCRIVWGKPFWSELCVNRIHCGIHDGHEIRFALVAFPCLELVLFCTLVPW